MNTHDTQTSASHPASDTAALQAIVDALQHGRGREQVNDANVDALIALVRGRGDAQLELLLREWRSPCGDDAQAPALPQTLPPAAPR